MPNYDIGYRLWDDRANRLVSYVDTVNAADANAAVAAATAAGGVIYGRAGGRVFEINRVVNSPDGGASPNPLPSPASAQTPDGTLNGGNARGLNAVDWQSVRFDQSQVASGTYATISGGIANLASGQAAAIAGGLANSLTAPNSWCPGGNGAVDRGRVSGVWSAYSGAFSTQSLEMMLQGQTTNATPLVLTVNTFAAASYNIVSLNADNTSIAGQVMVLGRGAAGRYAAFQQFLLTRGTGVGSTALALGTQVPLTNGTVTGWAVALTADTSISGLTVTVTGAAATNINWTARVIAVETL